MCSHAYFLQVTVLVISIVTAEKDKVATFFDTPPLLLMFIALGRTLEHIAKVIIADDKKLPQTSDKIIITNLVIVYDTS